ncbi:cholesterol transporter ABCA5-like [Liolophura sinensis]|uniref:cholesterol transporter ABCA5-like n=1 Tax=Liolophura sinensis TaxID=3198878 RepID=UPI0031597FD1
MGRLFSQIKILLWKNLLLKKRNKKQLISELLMPIYFVSLLAMIKALVSPKTLPVVPQFQSNTLNNRSLFPWPSSHILVAPDTPSIQNIMNIVSKYMNVTYSMYPSQAEAENTYIENAANKNLGVVFQYENGNLNYAIRTPYSLAASPTKMFNYLSGGCRDPNGLGDCDANKYLQSGFAALQLAINTAIIRVQTGKSDIPFPDVSVELFPKTVYTPDTSYIQILSAIYFVIAYSPFINFLVVNLVTEKEKKIKEGMRMMGLRDSAFWLSWSLIYTVIILLVTLVVVAIAALSKFFAHSNMFIFFLMLFLYGLTIINFSFMITPFFNKALSGGALASFATMAISLLYLVVSLTRTQTSTGDVDYSIPPGGRWALCLLSPVALALAIDQAIFLDIGHGGMNFDTISYPEAFPLYAPIIMLAVDTVLYGFLAIYLDNVIPSEYGPRRPPWYIFMRSYWCDVSSSSGERLHLINGDHHANNTASHDEDVEPVSSDLRGKEGIRIMNLRKVFKGREEDTVAVDGLTLDMYVGQITGLLGHNGAGKTTLINMLTGLTTATSGHSTVLGLDITDANSMDKIRCNSGVCPQHNILFDKLSCREHLQVYAGIKNVPEAEVDMQVEQALADVDLVDQGSALAEELSGGQKRKLSVAIALIGDPKVMFLDEPTAGMDPYSRRHLWSLLQKRKKGKIILLTTHFMDEADILADRKAIVAKGQLRCCGSSLFLKNRFGIGYHLNMVVEPSCDADQVTEFITQYIDDVQLARRHGNELSYTLPLSNVNSFPALFSALEYSGTSDTSTSNSLGIKTFGVSMTTLEEVFLKLGEHDETGRKADLQAPAISDGQLSVSGHSSAPSSVHHSMELFPIQDDNAAFNRSITKQRFWALLKIRFLQAIRVKIALIFQLFLPVVFVIVGCVVNKTAAPPDNTASPPSLSMQSALGAYVTLNNASIPVGLSQPFIFEDGSGGSSFITLLKMNLEVAIKIDESNSSVNLLDARPHHVGVNFSSLTPAAQGYDSSFTVLYNDTAVHSLPVAIDLLLNGLYGMVLASAPPKHIHTFNLPWNNTETVLTFNNGAFSASIILALAFALIPGGFGTLIVREREVKARSQLRVSGVSWVMYWGTSFIFHFLQFSIPAILCIIVVLAAQVPSLSHAGAILCLILLFLLYMPSNTLLSYNLSFLFKKGETAMSVLPNIFTYASMIPYIAVALLDAMRNSDTAEIIHYVFCVIDPPYLVFGGIYYIDRMHRIQVLTNSELTVGDYFKWSNKILFVFIMAVIHFVLLAYLLLFLEVRSTGGDPMDVFKCGTNSVGSSKIIPEDNGDVIEGEDSDVAAERQHVDSLEYENTEEVPVIVVKNVRKEFKSRGKKKKNKKLCAGGDEKIKAVVRNSTFAVSAGEVFGLLGPNGAGKTTTINMIIAEEGLTKGKIEVAGYNVRSSLSEAFQALGFCPQHDALWDVITLREHLHCYAAIRGVAPKEIPSTANQFIESLKVQDHADKHSKKLSGGTKRKLSYAMSMLGNPRVVLMDEPSTGMDPQSKRFLWDTISSSFKGKDRGAILTTHYMEEADALCSRVAIMVNGQLQCLGPTQHLKDKFGSGYVLEVKVKSGGQATSGAGDGGTNTQVTADERLLQFEEYVKKLFPDSVCVEKFGERAQFKIPNANIVSLGQTFSALEEAKVLYNVAEYSFSQSTLEQVFLMFAKQQLEEGMDQPEHQQGLNPAFDNIQV